jgi:hypothetical protein
MDWNWWELPARKQPDGDGESGQVKVQATSHDQKPIAAVVRLFRIKGTQQRK